MTAVGTSFPVHILATHPNIHSVAKRIQTEDLSGLYLAFALAYMSGLFDEVTLVHDASLRPCMAKAAPSTHKWEPRNNMEQAENAIKAFSDERLSEDGNNAGLTGSIRKAIATKIGPECTIPV